MFLFFQAILLLTCLMHSFRRVFDRVAGFLTISDLQKIPMALLEKFEPHISVEILERLKRDPVIFEVRQRQ